MRVCDQCHEIIPRPEHGHSDRYEYEWNGSAKYDICDECNEANEAEDEARTKVMDAIHDARIKRLKRSVKDIVKKYDLKYEDGLGLIK